MASPLAVNYLHFIFVLFYYNSKHSLADQFYFICSEVRVLSSMKLKLKYLNYTYKYFTKCTYWLYHN